MYKQTLSVCYSEKLHLPIDIPAYLGPGHQMSSGHLSGAPSAPVKALSTFSRQLLDSYLEDKRVLLKGRLGYKRLVDAKGLNLLSER